MFKNIFRNKNTEVNNITYDKLKEPKEKTIPYNEAKEMLEKRTGESVSISNDSQYTLHMEKVQGNTNIKYSINDNADCFKILTEFGRTLGDMKFGSDNGYVRMSDKNITINMHNHNFFNSISFTKYGDLTDQEIEAVTNTYKLANPVKDTISPEKRLYNLGVDIYKTEDAFTWNYIAGYDDAKNEIKKTIILPLKNPEVFDKVAKNTRKKFESSRPKAVLFEGPPGTGKTTMARIIGGETNVPLVYVPVESIMTKWYGESERNLSKIFDASYDLGDSIIFMDEIDSLGVSRDSNINEGTRRVLSVLLRKIDGFVENDKTILIGATNRKNDLDDALLSRFDTSITFGLPNEVERVAIFENYAKHLDKKDLEILARECDGVSGRNIKDVCEDAERKYTSMLIEKSEKSQKPIDYDTGNMAPDAEDYRSSLKKKMQSD